MKLIILTLEVVINKVATEQCCMDSEERDWLLAKRLDIALNADKDRYTKRQWHNAYKNLCNGWYAKDKHWAVAIKKIKDMFNF